jgi:hypothetical protein
MGAASKPIDAFFIRRTCGLFVRFIVGIFPSIPESMKDTTIHVYHMNDERQRKDNAPNGLEKNS